jgi:lipopolysaccharide transport system ATP-binding protein
VEVTRLSLLGSDGAERNVFEMGEPVRVQIDYHVQPEQPHVVVYAGVRRLDGFICSGTSTAIAGLKLPPLSGPGTLEVEFPSLAVTPGPYVMDVTFYDENFEHRQYFLGRRRATFSVESRLGQLDDRYGVFYPNARWTLRS